MRPYFAIIKDSFREAFASRVFWIILLLIGVFLLLLFPIGYSQQLTTGISNSDVKNWPRFLRRIARQAEMNGPSPGKHLLSMLDDDLREKITGEGSKDESSSDSDDKDEPKAEQDNSRRRGPDDFMLPFRFSNQLNTKVLTKAEFYDEASWGRRQLRGESRELLQRDASSLTQEELEHRNRLLLDSAFPNDIYPAPTRSVQMTYLGYHITPEPFRIEQKTFQETIQLVVLWGLLLVFGTIGIFASILVTASIIPQTFDPGSLNVLLSKPISRSLMFITQYLGGCVFIGIWALLLFTGIYFFLGMRLDYWNANLLFYIPSFVFVFAIYYSVSAMVGLIWRSPIMSTVITLVFWIACAAVGWLNFGAETFVLQDLKSSSMIIANQQPFPVDEGRQLFYLDEQNQWQQVRGSGGRNGPPGMMSGLGPVYDTKRQRFITQQITIEQGSPMPFVQRPEFSFSGAADNWKIHLGEVMPVGVIELLPHPKFGFLAITSDAFFNFVGDLKLPENKETGTDDKSDERDEKKKGGLSGLLSRFATPEPSKNFVNVGPKGDDFFLASPYALATNAATGDIVVYTRGEVLVFELNSDDQFELRIKKDVELGSRQEVKLGFVGDSILLAPQGQSLQIYSANDLQPGDTLSLESNGFVRAIVAAPDNQRAAVLFQNQHLWIFDADNQSFNRPNITDLNSVNAVAFDSNSNLVYVNDYREVRTVDLDSMQELDFRAGQLTTSQYVSRRLIKPLHSIFPQPGRLNNTVQFFVTGDDTREDYRATMLQLVSSANPMVPMGQLSELFPRVNLHPWPPVWNGIAFVTIMLIIGCVYFERQQF